MTDSNINIKGKKTTTLMEDWETPTPAPPRVWVTTRKRARLKSPQLLCVPLKIVRAVWPVKCQVQTALCFLKRHKHLYKKQRWISNMSVNELLIWENLFHFRCEEHFGPFFCLFSCFWFGCYMVAMVTINGYKQWCEKRKWSEIVLLEHDVTF